MKRAILLAAASLLLAGPACAGELWSSLWRNDDQRAAQLLEKGDAGGAAKLYRDPRRKAYAELKAGDFDHAAKGFSAFNDRDSHYNRGNALARAGKLQEALKAYDAALTLDPSNQDAKHNRALVEKALQQPPPLKEDKNNAPQPEDKGGNKQNAASAKSTAKPEPGKPEPGKSSQSGKKQQDPSGQTKQSDHGEQAAAQKNLKSSQDTDSAHAKAATETQGQPGQAKSIATQMPADDAAQALRDASAALGTSPDKSIAAADVPGSEKQLAQEQWLRQIPDDPSGLLRRKFLIEHLLRQQGGQQ